MKYQRRKTCMSKMRKAWWTGLKSKVLGVLFFVACAVMLGFPLNAKAANYEYLQFEKASMNGNTIWGSTESFYKASLDGFGGFYSAQWSSSGGLPTNGSINIGGVTYKLQVGSAGYYAYNGNDSVHLTNETKVRTIEFKDDQSYDKIYILATAGGPGAGNYVNFNVKVTYSDGSTTSATYRMYDWYDTRAVSGVSLYAKPKRVLTKNGAFDGSTSKGPVMRAACIDTDATKVLSTITFSMAGLNNSESQLNKKNVNCAVYAMTGEYSSYVPNRPDPDAHDIYGTGFYLSWDEVPTASFYYVDVSQYSDFRTTIKGYNNKKVTGNTVEVTGVKPYTKYYYRVRAVNSYGAGRNSHIESVYTYIPNTTYVNLTLDDSAWDNQKVELYQKGKSVYSLDNLAPGEYGNNIIMNGTYDIYVNGKDAMEQITFNYQGTNMRHGDTLAVNINYDTVTVTTRLNEAVSAVVGDLDLRQDGKNVYQMENNDGNMSFLIKNTENDFYDVYINNRYTGKTIEIVANTRLELDYYEMLFGVNYTTRKLSDASVTLCDERGVVIETLHYKESDGNTHYYSCQLILDEKETPTTYCVFVNGQNTRKTMYAMSNYHTGDATFYKAMVNVMVDGVSSDLLRVSMSNGTESYIFAYDNDDEQFINEYTLINDTNAEEAAYTLSVRGALRPESGTITYAEPELTLRYASVTYMIPTVDAWAKYMTQYVKQGEATVRPSDPDYGLVALESWNTTDSLETIYDFTAKVNSATVVYAKFEEPHIVINDYVCVDQSGTLDGAGTYYRMPNLSINGYKDNARMDSIVFKTTGCDGFIILEDEIIKSVLPTYNAESGEVIILDEGTMVIQLKENTTVLQVQDFLRDGIVVKPKTDKTHTMQITVYGDDGGE